MILVLLSAIVYHPHSCHYLNNRPTVANLHEQQIYLVSKLRDNTSHGIISDKHCLPRHRVTSTHPCLQWKLHMSIIVNCELLDVTHALPLYIHVYVPVYNYVLTQLTPIVVHYSCRYM